MRVTLYPTPGFLLLQCPQPASLSLVRAHYYIFADTCWVLMLAVTSFVAYRVSMPRRFVLLHPRGGWLVACGAFFAALHLARAAIAAPQSDAVALYAARDW